MEGSSATASSQTPGRQPIFPPWIDRMVRLVLALLALGLVYLVVLVWVGASPRATDVGYQPKQPVPYSHRVHAGDLGYDCRYCHTGVEDSAQAGIPPTASCMNCHLKVFPDSEKLVPVRRSWETGEPVEWVRVHDLSDFAYFNHSAHVRRGIGCVSCHGRIDRMEVVYQAEPLSMGWCLDCHRAPEAHLRPLDRITDMTWGLNLTPEERLAVGRELRDRYQIKSLISCSVCHR
jgi:hypothetical protein